MSVKGFLKQRAVNIVARGHYTLANWLDAQGKPRTFACRTSRVSPFRMMVAVPVVGKVGDRITPYFGDFGNLEGVISDTVPGGFLLELDMTTSMREKFASKLTWLEQKQKNPRILDGRKQARIIPASPHSTLTFADGTTRPSPTALPAAALSSTCRCPASQFRLTCSHKSECRWRSEPALAASSDICPMVSQSISSNSKAGNSWNAASYDPYHCLPHAVQRLHLAFTQRRRRRL
jgi:hypothetical protein